MLKKVDALIDELSDDVQGHILASLLTSRGMKFGEWHIQTIMEPAPTLNIEKADAKFQFPCEGMPKKS